MDDDAALKSKSQSDGRDWSPDGTRILYVSKVGGQELELFVMDKDGNNVRQLNYKVLSGTGTWGPDGRRIAFTSDKSGGFEIYVIDIEGTWQVAT